MNHDHFTHLIYTEDDLLCVEGPYDKRLKEIGTLGFMKSIKKNRRVHMFIKGVDVTTEVNLSDGYVSLWENDYDNEVMVYSFYDHDTENFKYSVIPKQDMEDYLDDYDESFADYLGLPIKEVKNMHPLNFFTSLQSYYGIPFQNFKTAETIEELKREANI